MNRSNRERLPEGHAAQAGALAEDLVRDWLIQEGWQVLHQRWHCRWGELDLIASDGQNTLAFVEVKARGQRNWDRNGLLAITPQKQAKLLKAAQLFLSEQPMLLDYFCRFDVALVSWRKDSKEAIAPLASTEVTISQPVYRAPCWLTLDQYLPGAFDTSS